MSALLLLVGRALASPSGAAPSDGEDGVGSEAVDEASGIDEEVARSPLDAGAVVIEDSFAAMSGTIDVTSLNDLEARHQRPSPWGRLDLAITWRRNDRVIDAADAVLSSSGVPKRRDELWLVATWRN